jgi:hypothetical protein
MMSAAAIEAIDVAELLQIARTLEKSVAGVWSSRMAG